MTAEWRAVESWAKARLDAARQRLEGPLDQIETANTRGRIASLKELIALPETLDREKASQSLNGGPD